MSEHEWVSNRTSPAAERFAAGLQANEQAIRMSAQHVWTMAPVDVGPRRRPWSRWFDLLNGASIASVAWLTAVAITAPLFAAVIAALLIRRFRHG